MEQGEIAFEEERFSKMRRWLFESMEARFFEELSPDWVKLILHTLVHFETTGYFASLHLKKKAIVLALDAPGVDLKILKSFLTSPIASFATYLSKTPLQLDGVPAAPLKIAVLYFERQPEPLSDQEKEELRGALESKFPKDELELALSKVDADLIRALDYKKSRNAIELFIQSTSTDDALIEVAEIEGVIGVYSLLLSWRDPPQEGFLWLLAKVIESHGLALHEAKMSRIALGPGGSEVVLLAIEMTSLPGRSYGSEELEELILECSMVKMVNRLDTIEELLVDRGQIGGSKALLLRPLASFVHQLLVHLDPGLFTLENVYESLTRHPELTALLAKAFEYRFHPKKRDQALFQSHVQQLSGLISALDTGNPLFDSRRRAVLQQGLYFIEHLLKCNFYTKRKSALSFRLDPTLLEKLPYDRKRLFPELPFAIFYFKTCHGLGLHIRFADLARGGLRTIVPEPGEKVAAELQNVFLECYGLALTQNIKNKDIPEGGAKGVLFLKGCDLAQKEANFLKALSENKELPQAEIERQRCDFAAQIRKSYLEASQRGYIHALLDLLIPGCERVDYYGKEENIYLGPDENMSEEMIEWIASCALERGYGPGRSFITGKKLQGIGHKRYGVTSLGVSVYVDAALKFANIDSEKPFTAKMTGGPDGDVAGNLLVNLYKNYGSQVRLLALTDVSGTIFDPEGLDFSCLLDLFHKGQSIHNYPPERLHEGGFLLDRMKKRVEAEHRVEMALYRCRSGVHDLEYISASYANTLFRRHLHKVECDLFLPCGGRPRTISEENIDEFLNGSGKPTSKVIVEGANLYFSDGARRMLEQKGAVIIKDSSANKGGVIASSFEVLFGLLLDVEEFEKERERIVDEVLMRIKLLAGAEAALLFKENLRTKRPLTELSDEISKRIRFFKGQILEHLATKSSLESDYQELLLSYLPAFLTLRLGPSLLERIPRSHQHAIIASKIASYVVYNRGLDFWPSLVDVLPSIIKEIQSH